MGRTKYIKNPQLLWKEFLLYQEWVKANPFLENDFTKDGKEVIRKKMRAPSIQGFENHLASKGLISDLSDYLRNKDGRYKDFEAVSKRIKSNIFSEQLEGAMSGVFHHAVVCRLLGLVDRKETEVKHVEQPLLNLDEKTQLKIE
jgi:hypothetical protein